MKKSYYPLLLLPMLWSCGRFGNDEAKGDQKERIVCISKQYTEYIYALGAEKDIVAVDISSVYPEAVKKLPTVGYHRALSFEGIVSANPTLILHEGRKSLGPEHVVTQLEQLNIPQKVFDSKSKDIEGTKALLREMGEYFHKEKRADSLCTLLDNEVQMATDSAKHYTDKPKVLVIHFGQAKNIYMVMTKPDSPMGKMIQWAGGELAISDTSNMRQLSAEVVTQSDPDVILLTEYGYDRLGTPEKIRELPGVALTKASKNNRIYRIEAHDLIYLGPRTGTNTLKLQHLIHHGATQ